MDRWCPRSPPSMPHQPGACSVESLMGSTHTHTHTHRYTNSDTHTHISLLSLHTHRHTHTHTHTHSLSASSEPTDTFSTGNTIHAHHPHPRRTFPFTTSLPPLHCRCDGRCLFGIQLLHAYAALLTPVL